MTFAVIENGSVSGFVVNATEAEARQTLETHKRNGSLVRVTLKQAFPAMFRACLFGRNDAEVTIWSKVKLLAKGVSA